MDVVPLIVLANFFRYLHQFIHLVQTNRQNPNWCIHFYCWSNCNFSFKPDFNSNDKLHGFSNCHHFGLRNHDVYFVLHGTKKYPIPYDKKSIFTYLGLAIVLSGNFILCANFTRNLRIRNCSYLVFAYFVYRNEKETILTIIRRK